MSEFVKPFVRVKDLRTGHQFDVKRERVDPEYHELVDRVPDSWHARPAKPNMKRPRKRTSTNEVVEGVSPVSES